MIKKVGVMLIESSAPGKLILFGEHASSRDKPSIVFAVNLRLKAVLSPTNQLADGILLTSKDLNVIKAQYPSERLNLVSKAISIFYEKTGCPKESLELVISSNILPGFGSSAASIVTTLGAFDAYYQTNLSRVDLLRLGFEANFAIKGYGSGLDIATAIFGGLIWYQKGREPRALPYEELNFVVGNTGVKVPSGPIVKAVKEFEQREPEKAKEIFNQIGGVVSEAEKAILSADQKRLGELMNRNQELLNMLNVSSPILEKLISTARKEGAFGAKLSGAGVGDNMIALVPKEAHNRVANAINLVGGKVLREIKITPRGLIVKTRDQ